MKGTIMLLGGLLLLGGCVSQRPSTAWLEDTVAVYGACVIVSGVDQFTDEVAQHLLSCGHQRETSAQFGSALRGVIVTCYSDHTDAILTPESGVWRNNSAVSVRYRADKADVQHDRGWWKTAHGGAVTFEADKVERLLVTLAGATDRFVFQLSQLLGGGQHSHAVELIGSDTAGAVADLRARCAGFEETG